MKASAMLALASHGGHSAHVKMRLLVNGLSLAVAQMGPDFVLVDAPVNHPPAETSVVLRVDRAERRWRVRLPDGIFANTRRVAIEAGT